MKQLNWSTAVLLCAGALVASGCGGGPGITSLSALPKISAGVQSSSSYPGISFAKPGQYSLARNGEVPPSVAAVSTTGTKLSTGWTTANFSGKSAPMCFMGQMARGMYQNAANNDKVGCYVGVMEKHSLFKDSDAASDGSNYYTLDLGGGQSLKIKYRKTRSGNAITRGEMWTCSPGNLTTTQNDEYLLADLSTNPITMSAVRSFSQTESGVTFTYKNRLTASGTVNSSGQWTSKTINEMSTFSQSGGSGWSSTQRSELVQSSGQLRLEGYSSYTPPGGSAEGMAVAGIMELLGETSGLLSDLAIGHGSAKATFPGGGSGQASWNGDTRNADTTSLVYNSDVTNLTAKTASYISSVNTDITMTASETWSCSPPTGITSTAVDYATRYASDAAFKADFDQCNTVYTIDLNDWVDCPNS